MLWKLLVVLSFMATGCNRTEQVHKERKDFSTERASFEFYVSSTKSRAKVFLEADTTYVFDSRYKILFYGTTPSGQLLKNELAFNPTSEFKPSSGSSGYVAGETHQRTDQHSVLTLPLEVGTYHLDLVQTEISDRAKISSVTLLVQQ